MVGLIQRYLPTIINLFWTRCTWEDISRQWPTFCSQQVKQFLQEWACVPSGNSIAERSHWSIKKIAARKQCTISEATYWYITPKDGASPATATADAIYRYWVQEKAIHALQVPDNEEKCTPYAVGDIVWIKPLGSRYTTKFKLGCVTAVVNHHSVEINGVLHHIKDLVFFRGQSCCSKMKLTAKISQQRAEYQLHQGLLCWTILQTQPS